MHVGRPWKHGWWGSKQSRLYLVQGPLVTEEMLYRSTVRGIVTGVLIALPSGACCRPAGCAFASDFSMLSK
jgi:hypothetical protein